MKNITTTLFCSSQAKRIVVCISVFYFLLMGSFISSKPSQDHRFLLQANEVAYLDVEISIDEAIEDISIEQTLQFVLDSHPEIQQQLENFITKDIGSKAIGRNQRAAIYLYGVSAKNVENCVYSMLKAIWLSEEISKQIENWSYYLKLLFSGLQQLPSYQGEAYLIIQDDLSKKYEKNMAYTLKNFSSWTDQESSSTISKNLHVKVYTTLIIKCLSGKEITDFKNDSQFKEIILLPGTQFLVEDIKKSEEKSKPIVMCLQEINPSLTNAESRVVSKGLYAILLIYH